jgi:hypothetical protein
MWLVIVAMFIICALVFALVYVWDTLTPLPRHPLYESVLHQVHELEARKGHTSNVERRS